MLDQGKFMEMLHAITEVAKVQENRITKEEIQEYFSGMELQEMHYEHIYQYLGENGITIPGFLYKKIEEVVEEPKDKEKKEEGKQKKQSPILNMYMEDLAGIHTLEEQEKTRLFLAVRNGNGDAQNQLLESYLPIVVEIAKKYEGKGMPVEDLIQEGNIGLFQALEQVGQIANIADADQFVRDHILQCMVEAVDEEVGESDREATVLAKTGLISEAAKYLAEDMGRVATIKELAEYTKLEEKEIEDILQLSLDAIEVGKSNE